MEIYVKPERLKQLETENGTFRSVHDYSLTKEDFDKALKELNETDDTRNYYLRKLKERINSDKDAAYRMDDEYLLRYLRYKKYDCKKAYELLRKFYFFREENPGLFTLDGLKPALNNRFLTLLPYTDEEKCPVFWIDFRNWSLDDFSLWDYIPVYHTIADILTMNPNIQINGVMGVWDMRGISARHAAHVFKPTTVVFLLKMLQEIYPWRLKRIIAIHTSSLVRTAFNTFRYLIKKKMRDRIVLLGSDLNELHKYINPEILPKEYGGCVEEKECYLTEHILDNMDYLKYERTFGPF